MNRIYLSPPDVRTLERSLLMEAVDSGWVAPIGPHLDAFEKETAAAAGVDFAVGLSSGTAALHLALVELGIGAGDDVLVSTFTFAATANAVRYVGANPVFIDSSPDSWNISPDLLAEELIERTASGRRPKAAIVVDLYGQCADYDRIVPLLAAHGVALVEDAAEALGASRRARPAGSFGRCSILSFNGNKIITSSGGGMLLCNDENFARRIRHLATQARESAPHYEHVEVGYNYRLSNLLAAFGLGQLRTLEERVARRKTINERYQAALAGYAGLVFAPVAAGNKPNWWLTCFTIDPAIGVTPEAIRLHLEAADIESRPLWKPMHLQPLYATAQRRIDGTSELLYETGLCLPSGSGMSDLEQDRVLDCLVEVIPR